MEHDDKYYERWERRIKLGTIFGIIGVLAPALVFLFAFLCLVF